MWKRFALHTVYFLYYDAYYAVACPSLTDSTNGEITCSLGDDGVPSYEDTCSFRCSTGYYLTGYDIWTCQRDGSWSYNEVTCVRGTQFL